MSLPAVQTATTALEEIDADVVVFLGLRADETVRTQQNAPILAETLALLGFEGKRDELVRLPSPEGWRAPVVAFVGAGTAHLDTESARYAAGAAIRRLAGVERVAIAFEDDGMLATADLVRSVVEGAALGGYDYLVYRNTSLEGRRAPVRSVLIRTPHDDLADALRTALATADAVSIVRDLVNEPPLDLYPSSFAERVSELSEDLPLEVEVWEEERLAEGGFGGILGVGSGSARPPRLVKVSYAPAGASRHIALVGKGITFDSGGLSLKPPASMVTMKYDMSGAATVFAVVRAAAALALPVRVTAWLCLAENMPSGSAVRPGDVLTIRGGRTVEVLNTDAEGRLVLADGIVAASEEHPDAIIDVATLTGAATVALGTRYVGALGDDDLVGEVLDCADEADELLWRMPLPAELHQTLLSDIADTATVRPGNTVGGMLIGAHFLREFVGCSADGSDRIPWVHLDIAGAALNRDSAYGFTPKGPTGATVRTLLALTMRTPTG